MDGSRTRTIATLGFSRVIATLAACGGGSGDSSSDDLIGGLPPGGEAPQGDEAIGAVGVGVITGFGSVLINEDQVFATNNRSRFFVDDNEVSEAELEAEAEGMVALVEIRDDVSDDFRSGTLARVVAGTAVKGAVTALDPLHVLGQPVVVTGDTVLANLANIASLGIDDMVEVSGFTGSQNVVQATRVQFKPQGIDEWKLTGTVTATQGERFDVGQQTVSLAGGALVNDCIDDAPRIGDFVEVKANPLANFSLTDRVLVATKVECKALGLEIPVERVGDQLRAQVQGFISAIGNGGNPLVIDGQTVVLTDATTFRNGTREDLELGVKVEARGQLDAQTRTLTASRISFRETRVRIEAPLAPADVASGGDRLTLLGVVVHWSALTEDEDGIFAAAGLPSQVEVRGFVDRTGTVFATRVRETREEPRPDDTRLRGPARDIDTTVRTLSVLGVQVQPGQGTTFRDRGDQTISEAAFFGAITEGTPVQVRRGTFTDGSSPRIDNPERLEIED
jgi:hypothetical protein